MRWVADLVYLVVGLLYLPVALYHALIVGKNRGGWGERLGFVRRFDPARRRIWIHAVSLGEINATPRLVAALNERLPGYEIVFSTTTDTGFARAVKLYGRDRVFRFPLDFSVIVARVLKRVRPAMIVLVELEVWFNLTRMASKRGVPVAVVNGRLTERSARRLERLGPAVRAMFADLAWVGAQDKTIADRFGKLGVAADRIEVTSSMKWDTAAVADRIEGAEELAEAVGIDRKRPVWVCGSTGPSEEEIILNAYRRLGAGRDDVRGHGSGPEGPSASPSPLPQLILVPRKPERFEDVAGLIERAGFGCVQRSRQPDGSSPPAVTSQTPVVLGDTMGELRKFYSLADVVFVGRSLVAMGGSDPMEAAALGKAVVVGPHTDNFRAAVEAFRQADAIRIVGSGEALAGAIEQLLSDAGEREAVGRRARSVVMEHQGATERTAERLCAMLARSEAALAAARRQPRSAEVPRPARDVTIYPN